MTVFVAVIIVIALGIVSLIKMTPDLLPSIDLPYVVVMTTYPGATPEEVEQTVSKPLEQNLATVENLKSVQSVSNANYSSSIPCRAWIWSRARGMRKSARHTS